jgi:hypothetical protein
MNFARGFFSSPNKVRNPRLLAALVSAALLLCAVAASAQSTTHAPGWVVLSLFDYRTLYARAYPPEREPEPPPVDATLTRVDYDLQINGELAEGRASLTIDVLKNGWVRVPIPSGLLVRAAQLDGKLVSLVPSVSGSSSNQLCALLSRTGRSVLLLDVAFPVISSAGEERLSLPSTASGVTRAAVQVRRQNVHLQLAGGLLAGQSQSGSFSNWLAYGSGDQPLTFTWKRKIEDHRSSQPLRLRGSLTELAGLGEDSTSIVADVNLEVVQGAASEVRISLPNKVTINQVAGALVSDWEIKDGQLVVTFLEPLEQNAKFIVSGETRSPRDGKIEIPILRLLNTERDSGGVAVEILGAGEIKEFKSEGLESADATDLGEVVANRQSGSLSAFRFRAGDANTVRSLAVNVARYTPQAVLMANIAEARYNVLITRDGKLLVQARYAIRNNQRNFLRITLPPGSTLWSAELAGQPVRPGQAPDGSVLLPLEKSRAGEDAPEFAAEIIYLGRATVWSNKGQYKLELPALDLPISRTGLLVYHPPLFKVTPETGAFRAETYENPVSVALNPPPPPHPIAMSMTAPAAPSPAMAGGEISVQNQSSIVTDQPPPQTVFDNFRMALQGGKAAGILPIEVSFPSLGPSLFLVSELTAENQSPSAELNYQHEKKAGGR